MVDGKIQLEDGFMLDHQNIRTSSLANAFLLATLAATSLGLATQYVTLTASKHVLKNLQKTLELPDYIEIYDTIALGYPVYKPQQKYMRDLGSMVHFNKFDEGKVMSDKELDQQARSMANMRNSNQ